jgi:polyhydroxyalkanoate synthesis regulator phasin
MKNRQRPTTRRTVDTLADRARQSAQDLLRLRNAATLDNAREFAGEIGEQVARRTKGLRKDLSRRAARLGSNVEKQMQALATRVDNAVRSALASLNIPTRAEISKLSRRVEELSRKIDGLKARR